MDKIILKFIADVLYLKGIICFQEFEAIMESTNPSDLDAIVERIFREEYNGYIRGDYIA